MQNEHPALTRREELYNDLKTGDKVVYIEKYSTWGGTRTIGYDAKVVGKSPKRIRILLTDQRKMNEFKTVDPLNLYRRPERDA